MLARLALDMHVNEIPSSSSLFHYCCSPLSPPRPSTSLIQSLDSRRAPFRRVNPAACPRATDAHPQLIHGTSAPGSLKVGVDGGNNALAKLGLPRPDIVSGDFDSIKPQVLDTYREEGARVVHTPDQDDTDFGKAVALVMSENSSRRVTDAGSNFEYIVAVSSLGGRLDHFLSNINTLHRFAASSLVPLFLLDIEQSVAWVLTSVRLASLSFIIRHH